MIELYGMGSPNVQKVVLALEELALPYRFHFVNVFLGEQFEPEFTALNLNSKVPVIVDAEGPDGKPLTLSESGAILVYLADKTGKLLPRNSDNPRARAVTLQWLMFQMASIGPMFGQNFHFRLFAPEGNEYSRSRYATEVERLSDVLDKRLAQSNFLAGAEYSIADIAVWPWLRGMQRPADVAQSRPSLWRWIDTVGARPAAQKMVKWRAELPAFDLKKFRESNPDELDRYLGRGRHARA
jgi:GST-like protein